MIGVFLILAALAAASPVYNVTTFSTASYTTVLIFNASFAPRQTVLTRVNATSKTLYVVGLVSDGTVDEALCEPTSVTRVLIAPRACDNPDPAMAVENSNCASDVVAAVEQLQVLLQNWHLPSLETDDLRFGPVHMIGMRPEDAYTDANILAAQGLALFSGMGPRCAFPTVTHIDIDGPTLRLTSTCVDSHGATYGGTFAQAPQLFNPAIPGDQAFFSRTDVYPYQRLFFRLVGTGILENVVLSDGDVEITSALAFDGFLDVAPGTTYTAGTCTFSWVIHPGTRALQPPALVYALNYADNVYPPHTLRSRVCNYHVGYLNADGTWAEPGCPEITWCGGDVAIRSPGVPGIPGNVPANPLVRITTCDEFYPPYDLVPTYGLSGFDGGTLPRQIGDHVCFAPFLDPDSIASVGTDEERFQQCQQLGGVVYGASRIACMMPRQLVWCPADWHYFDQNCYYKGRAYEDAQRIVGIADAETVCKTLNADSTAAWTPTKKGVRWLGWFAQFDPDASVQYRTVDAEGVCTCTVYAPYNDTLLGDATTAMLQYTQTTCNCNTPAMVVCRVSWYANPQIMTDVSISPAGRLLMQQGQDGVPHRGEFGVCDSYNCWAGTHSEIATCCDPAPDDSTNPLEIFFNLCYINGKGRCHNNQPRVCYCEPYYGPPASIDPSLNLTAYSAFPCFFPATSVRAEGFFRLDGVTYNDSTYTLVNTPCGGVSAGEGISDSGSGLAYCACAQRPLFNPDSPIRYGPMRDGASCTCPVPLLPPDGDINDGNIVARYCNNRGTCCPFGERQHDEQVDGDPSGFIGRCPPATDGCLCDNGFTGVSCTCPAPPDLAYGIALTGGLNVTYVDMGVSQLVGFVVVTPQAAFINQGCTPFTVALSLSLGTQPVYCDPSATTPFLWVCPLTLARQVTVQTLEVTPSCGIAVYETQDPPCGLHGNPYAGRFWAIEGERGPRLYKDPQPIEYAPYGCTGTACMCTSNFTGANCAFGVSGYRVDADGGTSARLFGEDILPPRGSFTPDGTSYTCNALSAADATGLGGRARAFFVGDACECAMGFNADAQDYQLCYGHCTCKKASFPMGRCLDDVVDEAADALSNPLVQVAGASQQPGVYIFPPRLNDTWDSGLGDRRSVIALQGESWFVDPSQEYLVTSLQDSFDVCGVNARFPVNMSFTCATGLGEPVRAVATLHVYDLSGNYTVTCDPAAYSYGALACPITTYCGSPPCIDMQVWEPLDSDDQLDAGLLQDVWFPCTHALRLSNLVQPSVVGPLDCNVAVQRVLDKAAFLATQGPMQCPGPITPYGLSIIGEVYGLVYNQVPNVSFVTGPWAAEHYKLVASIVNNERWFMNNVTYERLTGLVMDDYIQTWIAIALAESAMTPVPAARAFTQTGGTWDGEGHLNPYTDRGYLLTNDTSNLLLNNRQGRGLCLTIPGSIRLVTVQAPFALRGAQLISESGVCATALNVTQPGEALNLGCLTDPGTYADMLNFTIDNDYPRTQEAISQWNVTCQLVLYYDADEALNASDVFYSGSATQYGTLWAELTRNITVDHAFPYNQPLRDVYAASGAWNRPLNLSDPMDQTYLQNLWYSQLAPRKCGADGPCKLFLRHGTPQCVFDDLGYRAWRNGDYPGSGVTGEEGGCDCEGTNWDRLQFGDACLEGFAPENGDEWRLAVQYQRALELAFGVSQPVFNETQLPPDGDLANVLCRLPSFISTRATSICGGRGKVNVDRTYVPELVHLWPDAEGHQFTPACTRIVINGTLMTNANTSLAVQRFDGGALHATVIADTLWLREGLSYVATVDLPLTCLHDAPLTLLDYGAVFTKLFIG